MAKQELDYRALLQGLVDYFVHLQTLMRAIAPDAAQLLAWRERYKFEFQFDPQTGALCTVERASSDDSEPISDDKDKSVAEFSETAQAYKRFCLQTAESLNEWVCELHEQSRALDVALAELPDRVHKLLSDARGRPWRLFVRRQCLIPLGRWPRLPSRDTWQPNRSVHPRRPPIPTRLDWLLEYAAETNPTEYWQRLCQRMDSFIDDVVAIAPECNATVNPEPPMIPSEFLSRPMSLKEAASCLGYTGSKKSEYVSNRIQEGKLQARRLTRESYQFDVRGFPKESREKMKPSSAQLPPTAPNSPELAGDM